ncbi:Uncharacterised protein [Mycobacteroides abscessus subsp. abscessus]|nr:Uncharacterised protein [Mycobacteroides abscessus subsp. abscessus]
MVDDSISAGKRQEFSCISDQAASRNVKDQADLAAAVINHIKHFAFSGTD